VYDALADGGALSTVLNAANEIAVEAFLDRRIAFSGIAHHVAEACEAAIREGYAKEPASVADALEVDRMVRERSRATLAGNATAEALTI
jgi:1-deoxy-D-xylulose-5-phosphate reductoisomerase